MRRFRKLLFYLFILFTILVTGCSNELSNEEQNIEVRERSDYDPNKYRNLKEISNNEQVRQVRDILNDAKWEEKIVNMTRLADYRFTFHFKNPDIEAKPVIYELWISPDLDTVEVIRGQREYTQISEQNSEILYETLTGNKLSELEGRMGMGQNYEEALEHVYFFNRASDLEPEISSEDAKNEWIDRLKDLREQGIYLGSVF
ncbi:hypothetical protein AAEO50_05270 [Rossellomorea oryzaecorticis]|uniref:YhfM-like domain-containing protein n=1 Tax=Rossellomorea oryzaecorticis TaxID=1396505 RepID=A0ABU9K6G8_9BACI